MNPGKEILNVAEVSEWLRIPKSTMYKLCADGRIPCFKIGKHWRLDAMQLPRGFKSNQA
jgi:excisionase family DNA binding protein